MSDRYSHKRPQSNLPNIVIIVTGALTVLMIIACIYMWHNSQEQKDLAEQSARQYTQLQEKETNLKPNVTAITSGKFDLQGSEKALTKDYTVLTKALFGDASAKAVKNAENSYLNHFGTDGWHDLKEIAFANPNSLVATANFDTKITFKDFSLKDQTIKIVIYTRFSVPKSKSSAGYGIAYITTTYNFKTHTARDTTVQSSFADDN